MPSPAWASMQSNQDVCCLLSQSVNSIECMDRIGSDEAVQIIKSEPAHNKTYNKTCAPSKDSDQPVHIHGLIRVFIDCMCLLQRRVNENPCQTGWIYRLI